tara:strand:- start:45 stop:191 length:147 start_codon:yes stop_codon:yes gene_type:complete
MGTCYSKKDAKQIQWIKSAVVKVENKKAKLIRRRIEDKLIEFKLGVKL